MGQDIKLTASDNFQLGGYRADPAGSPRAAVVVIQEIPAVNHHIRAVCDRLAGEDYVAIAPSIFDRTEERASRASRRMGSQRLADFT
jgi:carboxymethylenebutenolidase